MRPRKLLDRIVGGSGRNVAFTDLTRLVRAFGFHEVRVTGRHHIFEHRGIPEILNLQPVRGEARLYQIRQLLLLVEKYDLKLED